MAIQASAVVYGVGRDAVRGIILYPKCNLKRGAKYTFPCRNMFLTKFIELIS